MPKIRQQTVNKPIASISVEPYFKLPTRTIKNPPEKSTNIFKWKELAKEFYV